MSINVGLLADGRHDNDVPLHGVLQNGHFVCVTCYIFVHFFLLKPHFDLEPD